MIKYLHLTILFLSIFIPQFGQSTSQQIIQQEKRIALVIGNGNYSSSILANAENDARSITEVLRKLGFVVYPFENLTASQLKKAIDNFGINLKGCDVGLFYYAGHGIQAKGFNYLIPVDAQLKTEEQVDYDCVRADRVLALMETSGSKVNVIILDACRNNPFERSWTRSATGKGLAFMSAPRGTLIAYATAPGSTASDGSGKNGLYTSAILENIQNPKLTVLQLFQNVRNIVAEKSENKQTPWESTSLTGDFYFNNGTYFNTNEVVKTDNFSSSESLPLINDWTRENLNGKVRSVITKDYQIPTDKYLTQKIEHFNSEGYRKIELDYYSNLGDAPASKNITLFENGQPVGQKHSESSENIAESEKLGIVLEEQKITNWRKISNIEYAEVDELGNILNFNKLILKNGRLEEILFTRKKDGFWSSQKYEYDTSGSLLIRSYFIDQRQMTPFLEYTYRYLKFDDHNNWLIREMSCALSFKIKQIREITYY